MRSRWNGARRLGIGGCVAALSAWVVLTGARPAGAESVDLYVDQKTGQVFTQPGKGRTPLGRFDRVEAKPAGQVAPEPAAAPVAGPEASPAAADKKAPVAAAATEPTEDKITATVGKILGGKWYERISLRGYTQFRYTFRLHKEGDADWYVPTDRSVAKDNTFFIRRARMIFSGDISDHLYLYIQPDMNALPADGDFSVQLRDAYADVAFDKDKEFRIRFGQSKVPYGFVNMQSSQNRLALERPDALNSGVEGERDIGAFFYWAPHDIRGRFRDLVRSGLKGSGDYGVFAFGAYSGQGLNRSDSNNYMHMVARLSYPFKFANGQIFEPGVQGYMGKFVPRTKAITVNGKSLTPASPHAGLTDERVGVTAVLYPQPIGIEAEWNMGEGPQLTGDQTRIDKRFLQGGYVQAAYKVDFDYGPFLPFVRWQYYEGGRKFARNAPKDSVNEWDFGVEWAPIPEIEGTVMYSYAPYRTDTNNAPYDDFTDASRLGLQVQWNF